MSADEFYKSITPFIDLLETHGYAGTTLKLARHALSALYLFLDMHFFGFHQDIMWIWFTEIRRTTGHSCLHWRRYRCSCTRFCRFLIEYDILALRFQDIDWKNRQISVVMKKTKNQITLPMPLEVGNAIYSYITSGRPKTSTEHIFIRSKAPYGKLTSKVCTKKHSTVSCLREKM